MKPVVSVEVMRASDARAIATGTPSRTLMYRAGKAIFDEVAARLPASRTAIVAGCGNNAGDGFVVALFLHENSIPCDIILIEERFSTDGKYYFDKCVAAGIPVITLAENPTLQGYQLIVDCIFGTGFSGTPKDKYRDAIEAINNSRAYVVSADINSGLNGDSGLCEICVKSDLTISIGALKSGLLLNKAKDYCKLLINADIGIPISDKHFYQLEGKDIARILPPRQSFSNKSDYGYIAIIGGSVKYAGAAKLANLAAATMRTGAGVVRLAVPEIISHSVSPYLLESTLYPLSDTDGGVKFVREQIDDLMKGISATAIGMGMTDSAETATVVEYIIKNYAIPVIVDADGLNALAKHNLNALKNCLAQIILTPHPKEMERLTGVSVAEIIKNPIAHAMELASKFNLTVLLKGAATVITDGREVYISTAGSAGMATAGSGDVLSGILAALLGDKTICASIPEIAAAAAYIAGSAGEMATRELGERGMTSSDTVSFIAPTLRALLDR